VSGIGFSAQDKSDSNFSVALYFLLYINYEKKLTLSIPFLYNIKDFLNHAKEQARQTTST
jgi:hypothetical protein